MDKVFRTYREQLDILRDRGIDFSSKVEYEKAMSIMQREGYYRVINGYKSPFIDRNSDDERYIKGTTVSEIFALYCFDRELREIFLRHVLHVETNIKSLIAYTISKNYGHDNYLIYRNFNTNSNNSHSDISKVFAEFHQAIAKNCSDPCIHHYLSEYGYVPLWVLNNVITLGNISRLYTIMKVEDRQEVSRIFKVLDGTLENFLLNLSIIRNFCAHGNRLYCIRTKRPLVDTDIHSKLNIARSEKNEYVCGKRDLFSTVIALRYLTSSNEFKRFERELSSAIHKLDKGLKTICVTDVLNNMGFPHNWRNVAIKGITHR